MRHRKKGRKLNRTASHRRATLRNMATSLFRHGRIETTTAKAKELRPIAEKVVTQGKRDTLHARRLVARYPSATTPQDPVLLQDIADALAKD